MILKSCINLFFFSIKLLKWKILAQKYLSPVVYFLSADVRKSYAIAYQCLFLVVPHACEVTHRL